MASTAASGTFKWPYTVGSPCAREIFSFFLEEVTHSDSRSSRMGLVLSVAAGHARMFHSASNLDSYIKRTISYIRSYEQVSQKNTLELELVTQTT